MDPKNQEQAEVELTELGARDELAKLQERARQERVEILKRIDPKLPEKVEEWKRTYPTVRIESLHVLGQLYIYRGLLRPEYLTIIRQNKDRHDTDELVASKALLYPETVVTDWIRKEAGIPFTLSDAIMAASGFGQNAADPAPVRL